MEKQNKEKKHASKRVLSVLADIFGELLLTAVCFAIGYGILKLFGFEDILENTDPEWVILPGCLIVLAIFGVIIAITAAVKKKKKTEA